METKGGAGEAGGGKEGGVLTEKSLSDNSDVNSSDTPSAVNSRGDHLAGENTTGTGVNKNGEHLASGTNSNTDVNDSYKDLASGTNSNTDVNDSYKDLASGTNSNTDVNDSYKDLASGSNSNTDVNENYEDLATGTNSNTDVNENYEDLASGTNSNTDVNNSVNNLASGNNTDRDVNKGGDNPVNGSNDAKADVNDGGGDPIVLDSSGGSVDTSDGHCVSESEDTASTHTTLSGTNSVNNNNDQNLSNGNDNNHLSDDVFICDSSLDDAAAQNDRSERTSSNKTELHSQSGHNKDKHGEKTRGAPRLKHFGFPLLTRRSRQKSQDAGGGGGGPVSHPAVGTSPESPPPDTRHKCVLHSESGSHEDTSNVNYRKKKLSFPITSRARRQGSQNQPANGPAPTSASPHSRHARTSSIQQKVTRRFTFPSLSKMAPTRQVDPRERRGNVEMVIVADTHSGEPRVADSGRKQDARDEKRGCGSCSCRVPLPRRLRDWLSREDTIEGKEIRNTFVVGIAFQLVFTAHYAIQNLQSSLHEEEFLGVSALGCLYATSIFSSIFAPTIIGVLGTKGCLSLAWLCHILYTLAQFYPAWETLVPAAILLGTLTGPTWTAQGLYVSACAFSFSKRSQHSPYTILSRFNGLFFSLYETRQILGNLLSSVVLRDGVGNKSEEIIFKFCGPKDCPSAENVTDIEEPDGWVVHTTLGIYIALQVLGLVLTVVLVTPLSRSEWSARAPVRQTLTSWFRTLVGTHMLFLVPFMIFQAMEQGILLSEYTKSYISCPIGIHMVGFVMATHGGISAVFVFIFSRLARVTGRFALFSLAAVISLVLLVVLLDWTPTSDQQTLIFIFPVLWGIGEGIWQTQTNSMIAVVFWDRKEPAFANYQTWRAVGYTLVFSFHSLLCVSSKLAIALGFLVVGMVLYTAVELHLRWKERRGRPRLADVEINYPAPPSSSPASGGTDGKGSNSFLPAHPPPSPPPAPSDLQQCASPSPAAARSEDAASVPTLSSIVFEDSDAENDGEVTLDGTYLSPGEKAYLDNDLRRYGVVPAGGSRALTVSSLTTSGSERDERWAEKEAGGNWNSGSSTGLSNQRPHSWHEQRFQDEGELKVVWTKDDVFVY